MLRRKLVATTVALAFVLGVAGYAIAGGFDGPGGVPHTKKFSAHLDGYQEVAAISSTGSGSFRAWLVDDEKIHFVFKYEGLEGGNSLFAHIHFGQKSVSGGVSAFLCGGGTKPTPCPNVEGTVEGDIVPADVAGPNGQGIEAGSFAELLRAMRAGKTYANIHTTRWPSGEIRGQINRRH
jgi:hypothetical protein